MKLKIKIKVDGWGENHKLPNRSPIYSFNIKVINTHTQQAINKIIYIIQNMSFCLMGNFICIIFRTSVLLQPLVPVMWSILVHRVVLLRHATGFPLCSFLSSTHVPTSTWGKVTDAGEKRNNNCGSKWMTVYDYVPLYCCLIITHSTLPHQIFPLRLHMKGENVTIRER